MRRFIGAALACVAFTAAGCTGNTATAPNGNTQRAAGPTNSAARGSGSAGASSPSGVIPSHGNPTAPPAAALEKDRTLLDTAAHDAKIAAALPKAKAEGASPADRKDAAEAYLARANAYRDAGNPSLYKFALADYNSVLLYDPSNSEARSKRDEIVDIYQQMGRPVPQLSNEK
jgi:hypothetical protein